MNVLKSIILKANSSRVLGKYTNSTASLSCDNCAAGQYAGASSQRLCDACPPGHYSAAGQTSCDKCDSGTNSFFMNQFIIFRRSLEESIKSICLGVSGKYIDASGASVCDSCAAGQFSSSTNATLCFLCPQSRYQPATGQSSCIGCDSGKL